jgi:hypothetical protein
VSASDGLGQVSAAQQEALSTTNPRWKKIAPYIVTLLIFALIFWRIPIGRVGAALENVPIVKFFCVFLPFSAAYWLVDSVCLTWVVQRFNAPLRLRDIMPIRASMYLLRVMSGLSPRSTSPSEFALRSRGCYFEHRVQHDDQLPHAGGQRHLRRFSS